MKILIVGMGSIGRRHAENLKKLPNVDIAALRSFAGTLKKNSNVNREFDNLEDALMYNPDGVIICTPTAQHVDIALEFLKRNFKILIEKPIAESYEQALSLKKYSDNIRVAYCYRFHPIFIKISEILKKEFFFKVSFKRSFYLPNWHPYADYRKEYTANKSMGGGVIRTLSHEIDLMHYWFGKPDSINGVIDKISHLDIDTDDFAFFSAKSNDGTRINYELDFFSPININIGEAFSSLGKYEWDSEVLRYTDYSNNENKTILSVGNVNDMYYYQLKDFIKFIDGESNNLADYSESISILQLIEKLEQENGKEKFNSSYSC